MANNVKLMSLILKWILSVWKYNNHIRKIYPITLFIYVYMYMCMHTYIHWRVRRFTIHEILKPAVRSFDVFFDPRRNKRGWENNRVAGDLSRYRARFNVIVMCGHWSYAVAVLCWFLLVFWNIELLKKIRQRIHQRDQYCHSWYFRCRRPF